jgi:lipopolysaccharide/colanic/teichoic acid biosynthesis glycosyltransferase
VYPALKRGLDLTLALLGVLLLAPLLLLTALLIKLEDGGSVLFAQTRVGRGGRRFRFYKFRSMRVTAEAERSALLAQTGHQGVRFKLQADPRITRVGRWIRRFSVDELPQLLNVVKGDLSLVGPRPAIPEEVERYGPVELRRLDVEQGLTCLWQVEGRSLLPFEKQVQLDLEYIRRRGLLFDLVLIARTIPAVLSGRGAF